MRKKITILLASLLVLIISIPALANNVYTSKSSDSGDYNFTNIVLFAYFDGENADDDRAFFENAQNREEIINMYDGSHGQSFTNYLNTVSYGKLRVQNVFPQDDGTKITPYCIKSVTLEQANEGNVDSAIIGELLGSITLSGIDTDLYGNDGVVDNLTIIIRGGGEADCSCSTLYSHKGNYGGVWNGNTVANYNIIGTYNLMEAQYSAQESGVLAHEFLHSIRFPDLYSPETGKYPVGLWDIMSCVTYKPSYPLAYMRMRAGWLDIKIIEESKSSLTLVSQTENEGDRAYILKSPLNDSELFVVEFRKKPQYNYLDTDSLDYYIQGSGMIVYRIDTKVENLSNYNGGTGVYVFPLHDGEEGYVSGNEQVNVNMSYFSAENGRTVAGSSDMTAVESDGALTFSDGSNSGIVISNISSGAGDTMTFDVTIPNASDYDVWTNTDYEDTASEYSSKSAAVVNHMDTLYMAVYADNVISLCKYDGSLWEKCDAELKQASSYTSSMELVSCKGELYLKYDVYPSTYIKKLSGNTWTDVATVSESNLSKISAISDEVYLTYIASDSKSAKLVKLDGGGMVSLGTYYSGNYCGLPNAVALGNDICVTVKEISGAFKMYRYKDGAFTEIENEISGDSFDCTACNDKLCVLVCPGSGNTMQMHFYDGTEWNVISTDYTGNMPQLFTADNSIYILFNSSNESDGLRVFRYDEMLKSLVQEGLKADGISVSAGTAVVNNRAYIALVRDGANRIVVRTKALSKKEVEEENPAKNGLYKDLESGKWYYYVNDIINVNYTGLINNGGSWWYIVNGVLADEFTGIVENGAGKWYVKNGKIDVTFTGLGLYEGVWYCVQAGKVNMNYTGLVLNAEIWWNIKDGILDVDYTGPVTSGGTVWYVRNGKLDTSFSGIGSGKDGFWYVTKGKVNVNYTGLVNYNDAWWYVVDGKVAADYTGAVTNSAGIWYVKNGKIDVAFKGLYYDGTDWICVRNGKIDMTYTGLILNGGSWWYVIDGKLASTYTGQVVHEGKTWNIKNGKLY